MVRRVRRPRRRSRTRAPLGAGRAHLLLAHGRPRRDREALAADIDLGVGDAGFLEDIAAVAGGAGAVARVHLKIDTGLHRNGIRPEDWPAVVERAPRARARRAWCASWACGATSPRRATTRTTTRAALFDDAVTAAEAAGFALEVRHLSASAASFARPEFRYDLVRVGAFCYGMRSAGGPGEADLGIRPIAALERAA